MQHCMKRAPRICLTRNGTQALHASAVDLKALVALCPIAGALTFAETLQPYENFLEVLPWCATLAYVSRTSSNANVPTVMIPIREANHSGRTEGGRFSRGDFASCADSSRAATFGRGRLCLVYVNECDEAAAMNSLIMMMARLRPCSCSQ